ncbi:TrbG/VirB9 family P-type conjugative transfer protein [Novosphingobium aquimarinum]|uniref:TrbG/VirB9 family P-type conjugative transfer protein n=1 Tax=Novosphingobium aquimarinum TaxID=2682494 RepID=UPI0012ECA798|nr:TrbG/VirB9 family P-type conjugative transfer protein [Novosphingobium aquimarinum]
MKRGTLLAAAAPFSILAAALTLSGPARADDRLVERLYKEDQVVRIDGALGVQATIAFDEDEAIENVAVGDSAKWQITPNKRANLLFVKPLEGGARTNMTVVTDRHTYFFDLVASNKAKPLYMLRFTYPDKKAVPDSVAPSMVAALTGEEQAAASGVVPSDEPDPAMLNFAWKRMGDAKIQPARVYDDGAATYLLWSGVQDVPAILVKNEQGELGPVNYSVRGTTIVIDAVPREILLRSGKSQATLENERPEAGATARAGASAFAARTTFEKGN